MTDADADLSGSAGGRAEMKGPVDDGDAQLRRAVETCDRLVADVFAPLLEWSNGLESAPPVRDRISSIACYRVSLARLAWREVEFATYLGSDLASTGSRLTLQAGRLTWQLRSARRELRKISRLPGLGGLFKRSRLSEPVSGIGGSDPNAPDAAANRAIEDANRAIERANTATRQAERTLNHWSRRLALWDRLQHSRLLLRLTGAVVAFNMLRFVLFGLTTALATKALALPFDGLGWKGLALGAGVGYVVTHYGVTPQLNQRFAKRLNQATRNLALSITNIAVSLAFTEVKAAVLKWERAAPLRPGLL